MSWPVFTDETRGDERGMNRPTATPIRGQAVADTW